MSNQNLTNPQQTQATTLAIEPSHSSAEFSVKHLMVTTVNGRFRTLSGTIVVDAANPVASRVEAEIDVASIDTGVADRDAHLRSADFFDAEKYPTITFKSTRVEPEGEDEARVVGDLTIRGVTREVVLQVTREGVAKDPWGKTRMGFTGETAISRKDFGLNWNVALETGGVLVSDKVKITLNISAVVQE